MSNKEQLTIVFEAVMEKAMKGGKLPFFTEEGIFKLSELMKEDGRGFIVDFREVKPISINIQDLNINNDLAL
jgi:hypothetical protein